MEQIEKFRHTTLEILSSFQVLEFSLKAYIARSYKIIKHKLNEEIPFEYSYNDIKNSPLENLLNIFAKLNNNQELIKKLNKLRNKRNFIAHQALLLTEDIFLELLNEDFGEHHENLYTIDAELRECLTLLTEELQKIFSIAPKENT